MFTNLQTSKWFFNDCILHSSIALAKYDKYYRKNNLKKWKYENKKWWKLFSWRKKNAEILISPLVYYQVEKLTTFFICFWRKHKEKIRRSQSKLYGVCISFELRRQATSDHIDKAYDHTEDLSQNIRSYKLLFWAQYCISYYITLLECDWQFCGVGAWRVN